MAGGVAEVAHLLAGAALALAFALLTRRRFGAMLAVVRAQSGVVAAAAAWQGWAAGSAVLGGLALVLLLGGAVALPVALRRAAGANGPVAAPRASVAVAVAAALVVLAIVAVLPVHLAGREDLALALAAVLVGGLVPPTRRVALPQLVGLLGIANGVALAAVALGAALALPLAVAVVVLFGFVAAGLAALPDGEAAP